MFHSEKLNWLSGKAEFLKDRICLVSSEPPLIGDSGFHPGFPKGHLQDSGWGGRAENAIPGGTRL